MFISFLLPKVDRGAGPLFHWVMLAQMSRFSPYEIAFLGDEQYFDEASVPFGEVLQIGGFRFRCPEREQFAKYMKVCLESTRLNELYRGGRSHLDVFRDVLCEPQRVLTECIEQALSELGNDLLSEVDAFLTWCNCPSLSKVADSHRIPVIHNELGPLRSPFYRDTVYFDFEGVNGNTSASRWANSTWLREQMLGVDLLEPDSLRGLLVQDVSRAQEIFAPAERFKLGVALQVQDDSNCVAFNRGWDELRVIYDAVTRYPADEILVRPHPHARFLYRGGIGVTDSSRDSVEFLSKIDRVVAVNSSVLAEAALWGVPFEAKGDCPVVGLGEGGPGGLSNSAADRTLWLDAFFLAYLVPAEALFDHDYYRWRLAAPRTLGDCYQRHIGYFEESRRVHLPAIGASNEAGELGKGPARMPAAWTRSTSLEARAVHAERELVRAQEELDQAGIRYARLEEGYIERGKRCAELEERLARLTSEHLDSQEHTGQLQEQHRALEVRAADAESELARLRADLSQEATRYSRLEEGYIERGKQCADLKNQFARLKDAYADLEGRNRHSKEQYKLLETVRANLASRYADLEEQLGGAQQSYTELQGRYELLAHRLASERAWQTEAERVWDEHEWMRKRIGELEREVGQAQGQLDVVCRERDRLIDESHQLNQSRDELSRHWAAADQRQRDLEVELAAFGSTHKELEEQLATLNQRLNNMQLSLRDRLRGRLTHLP